jgi:hypothetical protein
MEAWFDADIDPSGFESAALLQEKGGAGKSGQLIGS